jgi:hypothetical protein
MPDIRWRGGATVNTQHLTLTPGGVLAVGDLFTITMSGEDGNDVSLAATSTATTVAAACDALYAILNGSNNALFAAVTWSDEATHVKALAKVGGIPFYIASAASSTSTTVPTCVTATTIANSGPYDFKTLANFITVVGAVATATLVAGDTLRINTGSYSILYGLRASGVVLENLNIGEQFTGTVGDYINDYPLAISATNSADSYVAINSRGPAVQLTGKMPHVFVQGAGGGSKAVRLGGAGGDIDNLSVLGGAARGTVTVKTGTALDNVYVEAAAAAIVEIQSGVTSLDLIEADSGFVRSKSRCEQVNINGLCEFEMAATTTGTATGANAVIGSFNNRGARAQLNCGGTIVHAKHYNGITDIRRSKAASLTFTNVTVQGGLWTDAGSLANVVYSNPIKNPGGTVNTESSTVDRFAAV